nr:MAG TPA: hypothetical protein [Caudoviricetes sp.]
MQGESHTAAAGRPATSPPPPTRATGRQPVVPEPNLMYDEAMPVGVGVSPRPAQQEGTTQP